MATGASPQPDKTCMGGLSSTDSGLRPAAKTVSECHRSFTACSGQVAVAGRAPAGADDDATAYRRRGAVRPRGVRAALDRPDAGHPLPAPAAVRCGDPGVLLLAPGEPVRLLGADAPDDRAFPRRRPPLRRRERPGPGPLREG